MPNYDRGKHAVFICDRSGFKFKYKDLVVEDGLVIHKDEADAGWSIVSHPQNYPPEKLTEKIALRWAHPDVQLSIGAVASIGELYPI